MVGGKVIEAKRMTVQAGYPPKPVEVVRLWCVDGHDECAVFGEVADIMPGIGDPIWWQSGKIYFDGDKRQLRKVGNSHDPFNA